MPLDEPRDDGSVPTVCKGCGVQFPSKSAVFRHLKETLGACLPEPERSDFIKHVVCPQAREKVVLLYGYWIAGNDRSIVRNGNDVGTLLLDELEKLSLEQEGRSTASLTSTSSTQKTADRSYGILIRRSEAAAQEDGTSAITELITAKLPPLPGNGDATSDWIDQINAKLDSCCEGCDDVIHVMGRQTMPLKKFSAENDATQRRVEYLLPAEFLHPMEPRLFETLEQFLESTPTLSRDVTNRRAQDLHNEKGSQTREEEYPDNVRAFYRRCKLHMQSLTTNTIVLDNSFPDKDVGDEEVMEKSKKKKRRTGNKQAFESSHSGEQPQPQNESYTPRRRRYHNFTASLMAHDSLCYRRLDRFNHFATLRFEELPGRLFFSLSLSGDSFLLGQPCRIVGLFVAVMRGLVDPDIVDCVFDEGYPHLVPTPPIPSHALFGAEIIYGVTEGKVKAILTPRVTDRYENGWNDTPTLLKVQSMQQMIRRKVAMKWTEGGQDSAGRLNAEKRWTSEILLPWAKKAQSQLVDYRKWKQGPGHQRDNTPSSNASPERPPKLPVPIVFQRVLQLLQEIDSKGLWPTTTPKRQLVMVSTDTTGGGAFPLDSPSLLVACRKANATKKEIVPSAYSYHEGQGGASGSFSVGYMPGENCGQPKMNAKFPGLTKAAFELEKALFPDRPPSSTIAINRNAQFRPHTDSGAGAGQSKSLIVALGAYEGGELVVEGDKVDIRYKPLEFNGWKERHWTMPFVGERYSLVWFTPKGCEGLFGINL